MTADARGPKLGRQILAAGAVLWRPLRRGGPEVAVVHRPRYDDWSLPKGKLDGDESLAQAAVREVAEETGYACELGPFVAQVSYPIGDDEKVVDYYGAVAAAGEFTPNDEVDELRWLPVAEARELLSHPHDAGVLDTFVGLGAGLTTLLLVRHAKAGSRDGWVGDDDLRPLTETGELQAGRLRGVLRLFGPDRVFSAPRLRCVQTVRGLAADIDAEITHEPLLSEDAYWRDPKQAVDRLLEIAAGGGVPVVCSQGGVIPDLVRSLAARDGVELADVPAKKASAWVLAFRPAPTSKGQHRLVTAHYLPPPRLPE